MGHVFELNRKEANSRKRYNCFTAITLKKECPSHSLVLEENRDSSLFFQFATKLVEIRILERDDIHITDNCTIHFKQECEQL